MKTMTKMFGCLFLAMALAGPAMAADYDLVINNGRVMDPETVFDAVRNVGVKDGRIAIITKDKITGKETINAKGLSEKDIHKILGGNMMRVFDECWSGADVEVPDTANFAGDKPAFEMDWR